MLAGCGGPSTNPTGPSATTVAALHRASGTNGDLLYVADEGGDPWGIDVTVLTYPQGEPVSTISGIGPAWGICSDGSGNVWVVASSDNVYEFEHGGTTPIAQLKVPDTYLATGCAIDRNNGNLAVINSGGPDGPSVDVWPHAEGSPVIYGGSAWSIAYDNKDNLFLNGGSSLYELAKGSNTFAALPINEPGDWPGGIQWDGKYVAMETGGPNLKPRVYRVRVSGGAAKVVDTVYPVRMAKAAWFWIQDATIIATTSGGSKVRLWRYPKGDKATEVLSPFYGPWGITVSVAPSHSRIRR